MKPDAAPDSPLTRLTTYVPVTTYAVVTAMTHEHSPLNQDVEDVITSMQPDAAVPIYVLGCFARRVTLYTQQVRALNLVYALKEKGIVGRGARVGFIGGGAAGLTAAAFAAFYGCEVTVFERYGEPLPFFTGNGTRWLHPHIYDWPAPHSLINNAGLMVLNWRAGLADEVADQLIEQWEVLKERYGVHFQENVTHIDIIENNPPLLTWRVENGGTNSPIQFNALVVAVGFGVEDSAPNPDVVKSYWRNDSLHQFYFGPAKQAHGSRDILISGSGDGGLVDVFRTGLKRFRHQRIVNEFRLDQEFDAGLRQHLLSIEDEARQQAQPGNWLLKKYNEVGEHPIVRDTLVERVMQRCRKDTQVYLNVQDYNSLYNLNACVLNRFLLLCMIRATKVIVQIGKLDSAAITRKKDGGKFCVEWSASAYDSPKEFDIVLLRHGPTPALKHLPQVLRLYPGVAARVGEQSDVSAWQAALREEMEALRERFAKFDRRELIVPDDERDRVHRELFYNSPALGTHIGLPRTIGGVYHIKPRMPLHKEEYGKVSSRALRSEYTLDNLIASLRSWRQTATEQRGLFYGDFKDKRISYTVSAIALLALNDRQEPESQFICDALLNARKAVDKSPAAQAADTKKRRKNKAKVAWRNSEGNALFHTLATTWPILSCLETRPSCVRDLKESVNWLLAQKPEAAGAGGLAGGWGHTKQGPPHAYYTTYVLSALMKYDECYLVGYGAGIKKVQSAIEQGVRFLEDSRESDFTDHCFWRVPEVAERHLCVATTTMSLHAMMKYQRLYRRPLGVSHQAIGNTVRLICELIKSHLAEDYVRREVEGGEVSFCMWMSFKSRENYRHHFFTPLLAVHLMELLVDLGLDYTSSMSPEVQTLIDYINDHTDMARVERNDLKGRFYIPNKFNEKEDPRPVWSTALGAFVLKRWMDEVKKPLVGSYNSGSVYTLPLPAAL